MRVVFMGTPPFAVPSLLAVADEHEVVAVYTRPDKPVGRGREPVPSAVKLAAIDRGLPVRQPASLKDETALAELRSFAPDVIVVAAFGVILPAAVLALPPLGAVNVHASLLPRWRGSAPVQRAILAGDTVTGVSIMRMAEGIDTGPYCLQRSVEVDDHTTGSLTVELARVGADALAEGLRAIADGSVAWTVQEESLATLAAKITTADVALAPELGVVDAYRRIRASSRQAPSRACIGDTDVVVTEARLATEHVDRGYVHAHTRGLVLGLADGALEIVQLTPQGRAPMPGPAFGRGARLAPDARWGACRAG
jgi:methionyl-tRNA formyltransferase